MSVQWRRRLRAAMAAVLCIALLTVLSGCCPFLATDGPGTGGGREPVEETTPADTEETDTEGGVTDDVTIVPDVLGLYYDDAAAKIGAAGLTPVDVSIHGPIDEDAGEIGRIYRQTPAAGEKVAPGSSVELRSWWESQ